MKQVVYVLTLKTWIEGQHTYGRIHWMGEDDDFHSDDSVAEPDHEGFCTTRHDSRDSCIAGARRWFKEHGKPEDVLLIGVWSLAGWLEDEPFQILEGHLKARLGGEF
jgi:hypothetical protein